MDALSGIADTLEELTLTLTDNWCADIDGQSLVFVGLRTLRRLRVHTDFLVAGFAGQTLGFNTQVQNYLPPSLESLQVASSFLTLAHHFPTFPCLTTSSLLSA